MAVETYQIGVSRPPLPVTDLPTPEEVVGGRRITGRVLISAIVGPSLIALGVSIGSGEWLLGPFNFAKYGFIGIGWIILVSAILQVFYNVELARFTVATGEVPVVAFGRIPPGFLLWVPLAVLLFYMAFIWGGWASAAGDSAFALINGRIKADNAAEATQARFYGVGLLALAFVITLFGRRISRTMEIANWVMVLFILASVFLIAILVVPLGVWAEAIASLFIPAAPPPGSSATDLGALAGFTALASGLNYFIIGHYRDKGYGMGHKVGGIAGLVGGHQREILTTGVTFPENEHNAGLWRRWFRFILFDQWVIFFGGAILGILIPSTLVGYLSRASGVVPTAGDMPTFAARELGALYPGTPFFTLALVVGLLILFSTQLVVFESLVRIVTDGSHANSGWFQRITGGDPRRFYYPFMALLFLVIAFVIFQALPLQLIQISANMSNLAALIIPFGVMYLNRQLPRPARISWWSYVVLLLNTLFFGFFFLNFAVSFLTGNPLIRF